MLAFKWWTETRSLRLAMAATANSRCSRRATRTVAARGHLRLLLSALLLFSLFGGTAHAVPEDACIKDEKCKEHYTKGVKLYKEELFDEALTEFQSAYAARQMPLLLVNIGRTMQKLGRPKDALSHYERFLRAEPKIDPDTKKRVEDYITQVKALIESEPDKTDKPAVAPANPVTPQAPPPPAPPPPGRNLMIAGGAVALVGVAGLLTGVGLFTASNSAYQSFQNTNDEFDKLTFRQRAQDLGNGSVVSYILGTVALGTGGALIGVGLREFLQHKKTQASKTSSDKPASDKPQASAALVPLVGGGALLVQGGF